MPVYRVQGPDGKVYRFEGPQGASPADVEAFASQQFGAPQTPQEAVPESVAVTPQAAAPQAPQISSFAEAGRNIAPTDRRSMQLPAGASLPRVGSMAKGGAIGAAAGVPGMAGDIESLARIPLSLLGVSRESTLPTSERVGNYWAGAPSNELEAGARGVGSMASPMAYSKLVKGIDKVGGFLAQQSAGLTTGAGAPAVRGAYEAGRQGGSASTTFLEHMRSGSDVSDDAVRMAKDAVEEMYKDKSAAYRAGIGSTIKGDPTVLNFQPIEDAITNAANVGTFKGRSLSSSADKVRQRISEIVTEWKQFDPAEWHTPEGLDALKKELGDVIHNEDLVAVTQPRSPGRAIADGVYNAVKDQIVQQAPGYGKVMKDYQIAEKEIREITSSLSLTNKATTDTSLRKLQSILRNNANTNYGARVKSGEALSAKQPDLMPALAGQALNEWTPRGIQRGVAGIGTGIGYGVGGIPGAVGYAAASSPRLIGEAAFALGNARRMGGNVANTLKNAVIPGGGASIPGIAGISPQMLSAMSPALLAQLLAAQAPARQ